MLLLSVQGLGVGKQFPRHNFLIAAEAASLPVHQSGRVGRPLKHYLVRLLFQDMIGLNRARG